MPRDEEPADDETCVTVSVVRSGGFAGLTRRWGVDAPPADADPWIALIEQCPWDDDASVPAGADRFSWSVRATVPGAERRADLTEAQIDGPWRALIDAVRAAASDR